MQYVCLYTSILFNIFTNVGFNLAAINDANPVKKWGFFAGGLTFGLLNSVLFMEALKGKVISLQVASAIYFSLTIVGLFLAAHFGFNEPVSALRIAGIFVIIAGVIMVQL
jgi:multidrug transporter EmrE-like cation transporter